MSFAKEIQSNISEADYLEGEKVMAGNQQFISLMIQLF